MKQISLNLSRFNFFLIGGVTLLCLAAGTRAGTWNPQFSDNFNRANSAVVGNGWVDTAGVGSISGNKLTLTVPALGTGLDLRVSRPVAEAGLNQRIEATFIMPATNDGLSHSAYVRGKSIVIGGEEIYPVMMVSVRHSGAVSTRLNYKGGAGAYVTPVGTTSFTPVAGHSYTLALQITNNFPGNLAATLTDNTTATQVVSITYKDLGVYAGSKTHMSPDFKTSGVAGVAMEGGPAKSVSFTNIATYTWSESGVLTAPTLPVATQHDSKIYLALPSPSGGTGPYSVRLYRGTTGFIPPVKFDGSGAGTGTYLGNTFEYADSSAPAGVTNFSIVYRAVYFDSTATASTTGVLGTALNQNSPTSKSYAVPFWIGDSITAGYATSSNSYTKSPGTYAQAYLNADAGFTAAYTMPIAGAANNFGLSGKTSTDLVGRRAYIIGQTRFIGASFANIMLGTNDSKDSVQTTDAAYKSNIASLITALKAQRPDIKIVLNKSTWFKPDTGYSSDFSTAALNRLNGYHAILEQLADGTNVLVGDLTAYTELQTYGWTGTTGVNNVANATTAYPPAPTGGKSYLVDGLHPYDGGAEMIAKLEWGPNAKNVILGNVTPVPLVNAGTDKSLILPVSSVTLNGSATSSNSPIATYAWSKISGGAATIGSPAAATTQITGMVHGTYVFRLTVTNALGASGQDDVQVTVN